MVWGVGTGRRSVGVGPKGSFAWGGGPVVLNEATRPVVVGLMNATAATTDTATGISEADWSTTADAAGPILRRAVSGAILSSSRIQISFDRERGEYVLGLTEH